MTGFNQLAHAASVSPELWGAALTVVLGSLVGAILGVLAALVLVGALLWIGRFCRPRRIVLVPNGAVPQSDSTGVV